MKKNSTVDEHLLDISQISKLSKVTARTIRHYALIGLISQAERGVHSKIYFKESDCHFIILVGKMRRIGCSLDEIGVIFRKKLNNTVDFKKRLTEGDRDSIIEKYYELKFLFDEMESYFK